MENEALGRSERELLIRIDERVERISQDIKTYREESVKDVALVEANVKSLSLSTDSRFLRLEDRVSKSEISLAKLIGMSAGTSSLIGVIFHFWWK